MKRLCKLIDHNWRYLDYSNWMTNEGNAYSFKASRKCTRCNAQEYFYNKWVMETKSPLDCKNDAEYLKYLPQ